MFSLRSILFAAAAFASFASAVPLASEELIARDVAALPANVGEVASSLGLKKRYYDGPSVGDYFQDCNDKIKPIVVEISLQFVLFFAGYRRGLTSNLVRGYCRCPGIRPH